MSTDVPLHRDRTLPPDTAVSDRLQRLVDGLASRRSIPHALVGVANGDGSWRWVGAAGDARPGVQMRPETPFFIASVTKLFIATSVLQLWERGVVDLHAPIGTYLGDDTVAGLHRMDGTDHTGAITVRHLLSHTSGLPDFLEDRPRRGSSRYKQMASGADMEWTFEDVLRIVRDDLRPHFPPQDLEAARQKARYSDTGFQLLIAIIGSASGKPFARYLEDEILRPLDMRQTYLPGHSVPIDQAVEPAAIYAKNRPLEMPLAMRCFNDLVSTADDTLTFMRGLVRGELFEDAATYGFMRQRWNRIFYPMRYGLGMMRFPVARLAGPGRQAVTLVGHSGATGTWLFHCPELDVVLTGTIDQVNGRSTPFRFMPRVLRAIHRGGPDGQTQAHRR